MLFQGTLAIVLLSVVTIAMATGDRLVFGVGLWSTAVFLLCLGALRWSARYQKRKVWVALGSGEEKGGEPAAGSEPEGEEPAESLALLVAKLAGFAAIIFFAGFMLSLAGDALAVQSGLGTSFFGFLLLVFLGGVGVLYGLSGDA